MNTPSTYYVDDIIHRDSYRTDQAEYERGVWLAARPLGFQGIRLRARLKAAWAVFTGQADVLRWGPKPGHRVCCSVFGEGVPPMPHGRPTSSEDTVTKREINFRTITPQPRKYPPLED